MILKNEKNEENKVRLEIEVPQELFDEGMEYAQKTIMPKISLPGFRKGKVPKNMVIKTYGIAIFYEDMMNYVVPRSFKEALDETDLPIVSEPEYDIVTLEEGKPFVFSAEFFVKPDFELPSYKGVETEKIDATVTDEEVDAVLARAAENNARLITVEDRPAQEGDTLTIDYTGYMGDETFEGGSANGYDLVLGSKTFIPGFEDQLIGTKAGEDKEVLVTFPEDYGHEEYAGKEARFEVTVRKVAKKEVPAIDDEFIKDISEFDTVDEYRANEKEKMQKAAEERAKNQLENNIIEQLVNQMEVTVPDAMVEREIDAQVDKMSYQLSGSGLSLDAYLSYMQKSMDDLRNDFKAAATSRVKADLLLEKIAEAEAFEVSEADLDEYYQKTADTYSMEKEKVAQMLSPNKKELEYDIKRQKAVKCLVDNAVLTEKKEEPKAEKEE